MKQFRLKLSIIRILCLVTSIMICGCGRNSNILDFSELTNTSGNGEDSDEKSPFDIEGLEKSGLNVDFSYGWGITNYDPEICTIDLDSDELSLDIEFENSGAAFKAGIIIFIDGIAQRYNLDNKEGYVIPYTIKEANQEGKDTTTEFTIKLTPEYAINGKHHIMYIGSILNPDFQLKEANSFGHNYFLSEYKPWEIIHEAETNKMDICNNVNILPINDVIKENYIYEINGKTKNKLKNKTVADFEQNGNLIDDTVINTANKINFDLMSDITDNFRICCMVNNEPYPAFNGNCYADITIDSKSMAQLEMDFSVKEFHDLSTMYVIICPYNDEGNITSDYSWSKSLTHAITNGNVNQIEDTDDTEIVPETGSSKKLNGKTGVLADYLINNECYGILCLKNDVVACYNIKNNESLLSFIDLNTGSIINELKGHFGTDYHINESDNHIVVYENIDRDEYGNKSSNAYVLNKQFELEETVNLTNEFLYQSCVILPSKKKILYLSKYDDKGASCIKETGYNNKKSKIIMKFKDDSEISGIYNLYTNNSEDLLYFIGGYYPGNLSETSQQSCIGYINLKDNNFKKFNKEKTRIIVDESGAYFYDSNNDVSDGLLVRISDNGEYSEYNIGEKEAAYAGFSMNKELFWIINPIKNQNLDTASLVLKIYNINDKSLVYSNGNLNNLWGIIIPEDEKLFCGYKMGDESLEPEIFKI